MPIVIPRFSSEIERSMNLLDSTRGIAMTSPGEAQPHCLGLP